MKGFKTSAALFLLIKLVSLFYIVPFTAMAGESVSSQFAAVKDIVTVLIEVSCAGIPWIVYQMFFERKDNADDRTILLIRRIAFHYGMYIVFAMTVCFLFLSPVIAEGILGPSASQTEYSSLRGMLLVAGLIVFAAPLLYDCMGYLLGMQNKTSVIHAKGLEWIIRYALLFSIGSAAVLSSKGNTNPMGITAIWSIAAGCIAALYALIRKEKTIYQLRIVGARAQMTPAEDAKTIQHELISLIPVFLCSALFGNATKIIHAFFLTDALEKTGMSYEYARNLYGILQLNSSILLDGSVLIALWMFNSLYGKIRESIQEKNWSSFSELLEKWMNRMLDHLFPVAFTIIVLSRPIYQVLYRSSVEEAQILFAWSAGLGFLFAIAAVGWILLILMNRHSEAVVYLFMGTVVKAIAFSFFLPHFGAAGAVISSVLSTGVVVFLTYSKINNVTEFNLGRIALRACFILTACLAMNGAYLLLQTYVFDLNNGTGMKLLGELLLTILCGFLVYRFITKQMGLRKSLFHQEDNI